MHEKRKDALFYKLLEYVSSIESGDGLYDSLHNFVGMTNAEIEEAGYELQEYYQPEQAENAEPEAGKQTLRELIHVRWEDIHLLHRDVGIEPATIVELDQNTLTDAGKEAWADVLDAKVCRVYQGAYGLQVELDGVYPARLQEFSEVLAGYCPTALYDEWVAQPEEAPVRLPEMKL